MKYQWKVNEAEVDITMEKGTEGQYTATIGEQEYSVWSHRLAPHHLYAEINGQSYHFYVASEGTQRHVMLNGIPYQIEDRSVRRRNAQSDQPKGDVTPPMPGNIVRILIAEGDAVEEGQELLVLSAMKMETTLYSPQAGTIESILVAEGEQVMPGQQLVAFAQEDSEE